VLDVLAPSLTAVWMLYHLYPNPHLVDLSTLGAIIDAVSQTRSPPITPSVLAMAKIGFLHQALRIALESPIDNRHLTFEDLISPWRHHILPAQTSPACNIQSIAGDLTESSGEFQIYQIYAEARLHTLVEFMESCVSSCELPFKAVETIQHMGNNSEPELGIHHFHQRRFATVFRNLFDAGLESDRDSVLAAILKLSWFQAYHKKGGYRFCAWLEDAEARSTLKQAVTEDSALSAHLEEIVTQLDARHLEKIDKLHCPSDFCPELNQDSASGMSKP
jgi:hypothetical protein